MMNILQDSEGLPEVQSFTFHQPLAISGKSVWYLGFYLNGSMDDVLQVDHLTPEGGGRVFWKRLLNDDI